MSRFIPPVSHKPLLRLGADSIGDYAAFTDESSITGHRYMLVGGVSCRSAHAQRIHDEVLRLRGKSPYPGDSFQWKNLSPKKLQSYIDLLDFFLEENDAQRLDFSCLVIDTSRLDHDAHGDGDGETTFQKFMYQTVSGLVHKYRWPSKLRVFHGQRTSRYKLADVANIINSGIANNRRKMTYRPLRELAYMKVSDSGPHQIADVLLACVAYHWNAGMRRGGAPDKAALAAHLSKQCCANSLAAATPISQPHFDIWEFKLRGSRS